MSNAFDRLRVVRVDAEELIFEHGVTLSSHHDQDCCESHYLSMENLTVHDFEGLEFDLFGDKFFERVEGYGIRLIPIHGHPVPIPGYGSNNGYYSANLSLAVEVNGAVFKSYDVTECQDIRG